MNLSLSEDERSFQSAIREFAEAQITPLISKMDRDAEMDKGLIKGFFEMGLMGIESPEKYGGAGLSFFTACLAVEELSRVDASCGVIVDVQNTLVTNAFLRWASDVQKEKYLPILASKSVGAYCLSESGSGS